MATAVSIPQQIDAPAVGAFAITPSDSTEFFARALYIGVTGDVKVDTLQGSAILFKAVAVGILPVICTRVYASGTTATNIVGLM